MTFQTKRVKKKKLHKHLVLSIRFIFGLIETKTKKIIVDIKTITGIIVRSLLRCSLDLFSSKSSYSPQQGCGGSK